ncbi:MAG: D-2-hydroxyacid dehydrogenase [Acutalibacteraceae bacterium]|nr:D-2-hydroxyacid dehydrogenase [Acutalibacteraceae bacterium]
MKLVVLDGYEANPGDLSWDWMKELVDEVVIYDSSEQDEVVERAKDADILVTNKKLLTKEVLSQLPKLKYISTLATGFNMIDTEYARERGILASNIPAYSTDGVSQLVFALLLEITNNVALHNDTVKEGEWTKSKHFCYWKTPLTELSGKTLGIVGFGKIGAAVAQIANGFKMNVIAYSPNTRSYDGYGKVDFVSLDEVIKNSDVISLHCPLNKYTEGLVNLEFLKKMKSSAYLINTSRGAVIVEEDLKKALDEGIIAGAGVDVLSVEPAKADNPLLSCEKCIITPHLAWASFESRSRLMDTLIKNIKGFLSGNPVNVVN